MSTPLLSIEHLKKTFGKGETAVRAVDDVTFAIQPGETFGIVGESGSGKSTIARILTRLETADSGRILYRDTDITRLSGEALRQHRRAVQMVFQDPSTALDPKLTVREIICEPLLNFDLIRAADVDAKARELLRQVDLPEDFAGRFPHNMSGGQRQRVAIARAIALRPELIVLDEATSALDVSVQALVIELLRRLQKETGVAYLFICHDLFLADNFCHRIFVMQHGREVETVKSLREARSPYAQKLVRSVFTVEEGKHKILPAELFA